MRRLFFKVKTLPSADNQGSISAPQEATAWLNPGDPSASAAAGDRRVNHHSENNDDEDKSPDRFVQSIKQHKIQPFRPVNSLWSKRFHYFAQQSLDNTIEENWLEWMNYI